MQYSLAATSHSEFITLVAGKRPNLLMVGNNDKVYDKKPQRYAEDNVTQWWIWNLTIIKESARVIILLRKTTAGHKAWRSFSATELLVLNLLHCYNRWRWCRRRRSVSKLRNWRWGAGWSTTSWTANKLTWALSTFYYRYSTAGISLLKGKGRPYFRRSIGLI